jgi:tetrahydromethanopterin S-methyltransferase subunit C
MSTGTIIGSIIAIVIGFFLTWKAYAVFKMLGRVPWAEKYLASFGGTAGMIRLLGIVIIIIAFLYISGACDYVINEYLGGVFQTYK